MTFRLDDFVRAPTPDSAVERGPLGDWLLYVREVVGEDVWDAVCEFDAPWADAWLLQCGVVPFRHSMQLARFRRAQVRGMVVEGVEDEGEVSGEDDDVEADLWARERERRRAQ